jgi:hypothetical protein
VSPTEKTVKAVLEGDVMGRLKSVFPPEAPAFFGPRLMANPVLYKVSRAFRHKFLQRLEGLAFDKALQATQVLQSDADGAGGIAVGL